jgi:hypothetical protein
VATLRRRNMCTGISNVDNWTLLKWKVFTIVSVNPMKNGTYVTILNRDGHGNLEKVRHLFSGETAKYLKEFGCPPFNMEVTGERGKIKGYTISGYVPLELLFNIPRR